MRLDDTRVVGTMNRVYVAGHTGLVGSAVCRALPRAVFPSLRYDLRHEDQAEAAFRQLEPTHVVMAAGTVGGIADNINRPWDFVSDNLRMGINVVRLCIEYEAHLTYLGSSCAYPKGIVESISESALGSSQLEETNKPYATAKIAVIEAVLAAKRQYGLKAVCLMPCNLYGPGDKYGDKGHVFGAMLRKFELAKRYGGPVKLWGDGSPRREFMHVDDLARAVIHFQDSNEDLINVGTGTDVSIKTLAELMRDHIANCEIIWDTSKPNGVYRKVMDVTKANALGWYSSIGLSEGIKMAYADYIKSLNI